MLWAPTFAAQSINRFQIGDDGKTAYQRSTGAKWEKVTAVYGERVHIEELVRDLRKRDLEPRWIVGRYIGLATRSGTAMVLTENGVQRGTAVKRLPRASAGGGMTTS